MSNHTPKDLRDRVDDVLGWARSRIGWCRKDEQKFGAGTAAIEAARERMVLQTVVRMLTDKEA